MAEPDDQEIAAMRERAERVMARRAQQRADKPADEPKPKEKKGRRWYHWVIDGALFLVAGWLIKTRFIDKPAEAPAEQAPVAASASASASASAAKGPATRASAELRMGAGPMFAVVETLPPQTAVEVLEVSNAGYVKVKTPSGKTGWIEAAALALNK